VEHKFQINLRGLIDLLSNHLYSGPEVFIRELLQNGVDAIRARLQIDPEHVGEINLEVHTPRGKPPTVIFTDNGVGLNEEEVHRFLATIGESSKRPKELGQRSDFIGQFGIGILACFVVSDEIVVLSQSAKGGKALEWRAKPDGTYTLKTIERELPIGTQVCLTGKKEMAEQFAPENVRDLVKHYGGLLPYPIRVTAGKVSYVVNEKGAPWRQEYRNEKERTRALLAYGREIFEMDFLDAIPLRAEQGDIDGVAFVLPHAANLASKRTHRVYLKNMLLSENADNLLPEWTFFVKAMVNANDLRPTASRESFYEDAKLDAARDSLGLAIRNYLVDMARRDPERLQSLISLHQLAIKALAVQDDEFYRMFIDMIPFETTVGYKTFGEFRENSEVIRYVPHVDQFRQIKGVAAAQNMPIINAGYVYEADLLAKAADIFPDLPIEQVDPASLTQALEDLTLKEQESTHDFVTVAEKALKPFKCGAEIKKFLPEELPALYSTNRDGQFFRSLEQSKEIADPLWSGVLNNLGKRDRAGSTFAQLCFNFRNPLVRRLTAIQDRQLLQRSVQLLYVQSLLMGHHPLNQKEMAILNEGLLAMIEWGVESKEGD
jgi:molecular chaperone HtpG